ncbi:MAG: DUF4406 domain-containing protein [Dehalococcoidia bacterium]|jgi:sugar phosphate isomerase/epimerase
MIRVYISGPMKGKIDLNRPAFDKAERLLAELGYEPVNPHKLSPARRAGESEDAYYERCLEIDLAALLGCDMIYFLGGWMQSKGAVREFGRAMELGLKVLT